jgi:hypothetical protein
MGSKSSVARIDFFRVFMVWLHRGNVWVRFLLNPLCVWELIIAPWFESNKVPGQQAHKAAASITAGNKLSKAM